MEADVAETPASPVPVAGIVERAIGAVTGTWWRIIGSILVVALATAVMAGLPGSVGKFVSGWLERATPVAQVDASGAISDEIKQAFELLARRIAVLEERDAATTAPTAKPADLEEEIAALRAEKPPSSAIAEPPLAPVAPTVKKAPPARRPAPKPKQPTAVGYKWPWE